MLLDDGDPAAAASASRSADREIAKITTKLKHDGRGSGKGNNLHIDGSESTVGDGTADSAGKGESGVESNAAELGRGGGLGLLDDGIDLGRAG